MPGTNEPIGRCRPSERDPEHQAVELEILSQRWGLSSSEEPPDPSDWPHADPEALLKGFGASTPPLKAATAQLDPVEFEKEKGDRLLLW